MQVKLVGKPFGNDLMVANTARRSFGVEYETWSEEPRTKRGRSDRELINSLAKEGHLLPFRHPKIMFSCDAPLPVARQLGKHQVGMDWSEISRRYKTSGLSFYFHEDKWRADVKDRRQGSGDLLPEYEQITLSSIENAVVAYCLNAYETALSLGASPEQARFLLPQSMEASWTWTGSLLAWSHLYKQRTHPDAQRETRNFVEQIGFVVNKYFPVSWKALTE